MTGSGWGWGEEGDKKNFGFGERAVGVGIEGEISEERGNLGRVDFRGRLWVGWDRNSQSEMRLILAGEICVFAIRETARASISIRWYGGWYGVGRCGW